jgi:hypothetical protein
MQIGRRGPKKAQKILVNFASDLIDSSNYRLFRNSIRAAVASCFRAKDYLITELSQNKKSGVYCEQFLTLSGRNCRSFVCQSVWKR